jgi:hypothetical protein
MEGAVKEGGKDLAGRYTGAVDSIVFEKNELSWLPPRDSNPDMLLQRQLSYH